MSPKLDGFINALNYSNFQTYERQIFTENETDAKKLHKTSLLYVVLKLCQNSLKQSAVQDCTIVHVVFLLKGEKCLCTEIPQSYTDVLYSFSRTGTGVEGYNTGLQSLQGPSHGSLC